MSTLSPLNVPSHPGNSNWGDLRSKWLKTNPNQIKNLQRVSQTPSIAHIVAAAFSSRAKARLAEGSEHDHAEADDINSSSKYQENQDQRLPEISAKKAASNGKFSVHLATRPKTAPSYVRDSREHARPNSTNVLKNSVHHFDVEKIALSKSKTHLSSYEYVHVLLQVLEPQLAESYRPGAMNPHTFIPTPERRSRAVANFKMAHRKIVLLKGFLDDCSKQSKLKLAADLQRKQSTENIPEEKPPLNSN